MSNPKWFDDNSNVGWLRISDVTEQKGRIHHLSQRISKAGQSKTRVIIEPHLLLSIAATVGSPVINYVNTGVHDGFLIFLNPTFDKEFMFQWLLMFKPYWNKYGQPGSQVNLNSDIVGNQSIAFPTTSEQERIANFFSELDTAITLHEEKKRQLECLKSALLQKMFANKNGYPAVRFEGFDKAWKQSKLGEITKVIASKPYISTPSTHGNYLVIQQGDKPIAGFSNSNPFKNYNNITLFGDHTLSLFKPRSPFLVASDGIKILSPSIEMNGLFYFYELEKYKPKSEGYKRHFTILKKCKANFPTDIDEQKLIGSLLLRIDNLITKQQLKMDKLNETKESLLQNMFI
ncbi:restriction endonuclease subunit S [Lactobacillus delbrueckii]|uniref:restriction endonuclease subunit S n=1 Tax=Lactobacillus delbrueckii TaxID=1584 RepID=UPI003A8A100E